MFLFLFALALILPASISAQSGYYTFVDINYPGPTVYNQPLGINDSGQVVGYYQDGSGNLHGYLYDGGVFSTIDYPEADGTQAVGINNAGVISGSYFTNMSTTSHGFTYDITTQVFTSFDDPDGKGFTNGQGINNSNEVVGFYGGHSQKGFVYNDGGFTSFQYTGAQVTLAYGINDTGQIAGGYRIDPCCSPEAFFYDGKSTFTSIEYPDTYQNYAQGINNLGVVVGYGVLNSTGNSVGFLWQAGQFTQINSPGFMEAYGINNKGQIVGFYLDAEGNYSGFLGTPTSNPALQFVPVIPCRLVDTRTKNGGGGPIQGGTFQTFNLPQAAKSKGCPMLDLSSAAAYSLNVTVVPPAPLGYLTVWPAGQNQPGVSTMNSLDGRTKANAAIVPAGSNLAVSVFASNTTDLLLDIDGYFALPSQQSWQFYPLTPCRVADTRNSKEPGGLGPPYLSGGMQRDFPILKSNCGIPQQGAIAYSFNITAVPHVPLGYLTVWPTGLTQPGVSTLNAPTGTVVANAAIVPTVNGDIEALASNDTDLLIDVNGYFAASGQNGLSLYTVTPCRVLNTRNGKGAFVGELTVNVVGSVCAPPSAAKAYVFNATVVPVGPLGYLTLWPDSQNQPGVSTLNASDGAVTSNMAIVPNSNGSTDAYASNLTQLILDIFSYFAP